MLLSLRRPHRWPCTEIFSDASGFHFNASAGSHLLGKTRGEVCNLYKLKKLELLGFKSFGDRSRLEFADGVAAIVGPNGCGKSNLSDAVSWVLGEQSAKSLRGERMADVIFNGTGTRPPTSMAEVSMTLVDPEYNEAGFPEEEKERPQVEAQEPEAAAGDNDGEGEWSRPPKLRHRAGEITVTRRLFRSGESEYLINGQVCRLRDIQDLFMGTGLGPESYAIIEQGRIGQVLSSRPSDRRLILEEAAGVSKFKTRKRLAEAKLESSRQNLARIADILEEVTKQVNSLKRQASKARRYKELHDELRARLKVVLTSRWVALEAECARLGGEVAQAQEACALAAQRLEALEQEQKAATQKHEEWERQLTQLREQIAQSGLERERLLSRSEQVRQQAASLEARDTDAARERADFQTQLASLEQQSKRKNPPVRTGPAGLDGGARSAGATAVAPGLVKRPGGGSGGSGGVLSPGDACRREPCGGASQPACAGRGSGPGALPPGDAHRVREAARGAGTPAVGG